MRKIETGWKVLAGTVMALWGVCFAVGLFVSAVGITIGLEWVWGLLKILFTQIIWDFVLFFLIIWALVFVMWIFWPGEETIMYMKDMPTSFTNRWVSLCDYEDSSYGMCNSYVDHYGPHVNKAGLYF